MRLLLIIASGLSIACAQNFDFPDLPGVTRKPWTGPIADHQIGIHPGDTPEVAAAKAQHLNAYRDVLAVLPELPPEERYIRHGLPLPAVLALQKQAHDQINEAQVQHIHAPVVQTHTPYFQHIVPHLQTFDHVVDVVAPITEEPTVFAEDIPRSSIGEVPEVHAARVAHLKAFEEARAALLSH